MYCPEHEKALRAELVKRGFTILDEHRLTQATHDCRNLIDQQIAQHSRPLILDCLRARDGTREGCLICRGDMPSVLGLAADDVAEFYASTPAAGATHVGSGVLPSEGSLGAAEEQRRAHPGDPEPA